MKINIEEIEAPMISSFTMDGKDYDWNRLKENNTIVIEASNHTKTRIDTTFKQGQKIIGINLNIPGFKLHETQVHSWFSGSTTTVYYFVKSKKQDKELYKNYLKILLHHIIKEIKNIDVDELNVKLIAKPFNQ